MRIQPTTLRLKKDEIAHEVTVRVSTTVIASTFTTRYYHDPTFPARGECRCTRTSFDRGENSFTFWFWFYISSLNLHRHQEGKSNTLQTKERYDNPVSIKQLFNDFGSPDLDFVTMQRNVTGQVNPFFASLRFFFDTSAPPGPRHVSLLLPVRSKIIQIGTSMNA